MDNGFSGLGIKCLEDLNDEYSKTLFTIPVFSPKTVKFKNTDNAMSDSIRVVNIAMAYTNLFEQAALILPLSTMRQGWRSNSIARKFDSFSYPEHNSYATSAILATYLDTISLQYRLKSDGGYLPGFCSDLTNYGRKLAGAALGNKRTFFRNNKYDKIYYLQLFHLICQLMRI